jgi:fumarate hydratase class I
MADILKKLSHIHQNTFKLWYFDCCDIAHAKIKELLDAGKPMPDYFKTIQFIMQVLQNAKEYRKF